MPSIPAVCLCRPLVAIPGHCAACAHLHHMFISPPPRTHTQKNVSRANCNKIIMLFTDGGEEKAEEIFKRYNSNQAVRP